MNKAKFIKYISTLLREFELLFKQALKGAKEDPVHDMRVVIKRLNAVLAFLDESKIYKDKSTRYVKQLRNFFKSAGNLRDLQIQRSLVDHYKQKLPIDLDELVTYIENMQGTARHGFLKVSANYPKREQLYIKDDIIAAVKSCSQADLDKSSGKYLFRRLKRIERYVFRGGSEKILHKIRQTLKELRFFIEIVLVCNESTPLNEIDIKEIKEIESILGNWNDCIVFIENLDRYTEYKKMLNANKEPVEISELKKIIRKDMNQMVTDIKPRLLKLTCHLKILML
jgi:CHAD domain-containing protein